MRSASPVRMPSRSAVAHRGAAREEGCVPAGGELLGLAQHVVDRRALREATRAAVMRRGGGHRRQRVDPGEDVVVARAQRRDLQRGRDQDRAVQPDAGALLEHPHQPPDAIAAVALARDEDRRSPAAVARQPAAHELAQRLEVALLAEVLVRVGGVALLVVLLRGGLRLALDDPAEARSDRIDEHEIGEGEPGRLVLHEPRRQIRKRAVRPGSRPAAGRRHRGAETPTTHPGRR